MQSGQANQLSESFHAYQARPLGGGIPCVPPNPKFFWNGASAPAEDKDLADDYVNLKIYDKAPSSLMERVLACDPRHTEEKKEVARD